MQELQKVVFGNLPLLGISYQGEEKDRGCKERFSNKDEMKKVMKIALNHKMSYFASSSHDFNELSPLYLQSLRELAFEEDVDIHLITCIGVPLELKGERINDFRRWATHLAYESKEFGNKIRDRYLADPILNFRSGWRMNIETARPYDPKQLDSELKIDWSVWEDRISKFSEHNVAWVEPGSETDFLALNRIDLLGELIERSGETGYRVLLASHHSGATIPLIEDASIGGFDGFVTPFNKSGVMMFPTPIDAIRAFRMARRKGQLVIGIKPFAGGRINPREALEYVYRKGLVDSCMIGVSSVTEAEGDFQIAEDILKA